MVVEVDNTKQLNLFDTIRNILQTNKVLAEKFTKSHFYLFEPLPKDNKFSEYPYIVIQLPETDTDLVVLDHQTTLKPFIIPIKLVVDFVATDKVLLFSNAILSAIEASEETFETLGYINLKIKIVDSSEELADQKNVAAVFFELNFDGRVLR